jgi:hypothetical protein
MANPAVTIERSASIMLTCHVGAANAEEAEASAEQAIQHNDISSLGKPIGERYADDDESAWEVMDVGEA